MKKLINFLVTALATIALAFGIGYLFGYDKEFVRDILAVLGLILSLILFLFFILRNRSYRNFLGGFFFGDLKQSIEDFLNELPKPKNSSVAALSSQVIYRLTRIGIIGLIISCVPIWLLYSQNKLILNQTKLMDKQTDILEVQNDKIQQQNLLQEASRRNNLQFEISSILDLINQELKEDYLDNEIRDLSPELEGRIIALNSRLEPYYFMEGKELIEIPLSPERGQLFLSLINSRLDNNCLDRLFSKLDLTSMDLRNAAISEVSLNEIDFSDSDFSESNFNKVVFNKIKLIDVVSWNSSFENTKFYSTYIQDSNFGNSRFWNVDFTGSSIQSVNFFHSRFHSTIWNNVLTHVLDFSESSFVDTSGFQSIKSNNNFEFLNFTLCYFDNFNTTDQDSIFNILSNSILFKTSFKNPIISDRFRTSKNFTVINDTTFELIRKSDNTLHKDINGIRYLVTKKSNK